MTDYTRSAALAAAVVLAAACGGGEEPATGPSGPPVVMATTSIWSDIVARVACDGIATVETLIPRGSDPHAFEPSLADRRRLETARLIVANGLGLEEGLDDTILSVEDDGTPVIRMAELLDSLQLLPEDRDPGETADPHVWFDPERVLIALPRLVDRLATEAGLDRVALEACTTGFRAELATVDAELAELVVQIPTDRRKLVTNHDSLAYFADRYGFEVIGTVIPSSSTLAEANPAALEALAQVISDSDVRAIFAEEQHSADDAEALAERVGEVEVVVLLTGSLGAPGSDEDSYVGLVRSTGRRIVAAIR